MVQLLPQSLQVPVALVPVRVGDEGEQLGGAQGPGGALCLRGLCCRSAGPLIQLGGLWVSSLGVRRSWDNRLTVHWGGENERHYGWVTTASTIS